MNSKGLKTNIIYSIFWLISLVSCQATKPTLESKLINETPSFVVFSPDGKLIAAGVWGGVRVWNLTSDTYTDYPAKVRNETPKHVSFSPDGTWIAAGVFGAVRVWNLGGGAFKDYPLKTRNETPDIIAISPDGKIIATGTFGGVMKWDVLPF